jgi:hypothetical protein
MKEDAMHGVISLAGSIALAAVLLLAEAMMSCAPILPP